MRPRRGRRDLVELPSCRWLTVPVTKVRRGLPPPSHRPAPTAGQTVLSHHAPCLAHQRKASPQGRDQFHMIVGGLAVPMPRMLVQPDDAPDDAFAQGVQEDRLVAHVQRASSRLSDAPTDSPARPERQFPKAFGRPMAFRRGAWLPMSRIATPRAPGRRPWETVSMGHYQRSLV